MDPYGDLLEKVLSLTTRVSDLTTKSLEQDIRLAQLEKQLEAQGRKRGPRVKREPRVFTHLHLTKKEQEFIRWVRENVPGDTITYTNSPPGIQLTCPQMPRPFERIARAAVKTGYLTKRVAAEDRKVKNTKGNFVGERNYNYYTKTSRWEQYFGKPQLVPLKP